ncbi:MAG TPA: glycosyltransferase family 4 protein [Pirellulales bacterium]|nr:glycosyltransferase family 4 protein [Pirellulales bacterium]
MRVLIANDGPIGEGTEGERVLSLVIALADTGHAVRAIDFGASDNGSKRIALRRVLCRRDDPQAELPFEPPCFGAADGSRRGFADLTSEQLHALRDTMRQALDQEIADFDPQIVHCQHVWMMGHLALESGVPYVLTAQADEFAELGRDERYGRLAAEAAENAGRVLVATADLAAEVQKQFGDLEGRIIVLPSMREDAQDASPAMLAELLDIYNRVLDERWGRT